MICHKHHAAYTKGVFCLKCFPTYTKKVYPFLVPGPNKDPETCLESAIKDASKPLYLSAIFNPSGGNGPYLADDDFKVLLHRLQSAILLQDLNPNGIRFATIFRRGRPCRLHLDLDDSRSPRPPVNVLIMAIKSLLFKTFKNEIFSLQTPLAQEDIVICQSYNTKKTSLHVYVRRPIFADVEECKALMKEITDHLEEAVQKPEHPLYTEAKTLCWDILEQKVKHVIDTSIYHHNALFKYTFMAKPSKKPMIPIQVIDPFDVLELCSAHTPGLDNTPKNQLIYFKDRVEDFANERPLPAPITEMELGLDSDEEKETAEPETEMVKQITDLVKRLSEPRTDFKVEQKSRTRFYIHYAGIHKCLLGREHKNNNAEIMTLGPAHASYRCFSTKCVAMLPIGLNDPNVLLSQERLKEHEKKCRSSYERGEISELEYPKSILEIIGDNWVQINESKVLYGEKRTTFGRIPERPGMDAEDQQVVRMEYILRDEKNMRRAQLFTVQTPRLTKKGEVEWKPKKLFDLWIDWEDRKVYNGVVSESEEINVVPGNLNIWTPFDIDEIRAKEYMERHGYSKTEGFRLIEPWLQHVYKIIAAGNLSHFRYIMSWLTFILKKKTKTGVALLLMSDHGAGKSLFADMYCDIMGPTHAVTLQRGSELLSTFNEHLAHKILVVSEEATYGGQPKDKGFLKNIITASQFNLRPMFHSVQRTVSHHNLWANSNRNEHVLAVAPTERRYVCFNPSDIFSGIQTARAKKYFKTLREVSPFVIAWYHYFHWDIKEFSPRLCIPVTEATEDQKIRSLSKASRFILETLQACSKETWSAVWGEKGVKEAYLDYTQWCQFHSIHTYQRASLHEFKEVALRHLQLMRKKRKGADGKWRESRTDSVFHPDLDVQKMHFTVSLQLSKFPSLEPLQTVTAAEEEKEQSSQPSQREYGSLGELLDDGDISDHEQETIAPIISKRHKILETPCPRDCDGKHPQFVRKDPRTGEYSKCSAVSIGAIEYHLAIESTAQNACRSRPVQTGDEVIFYRQ